LVGRFYLINAISLPHNQIRLFKDSFSVKIETDKMVEDLKDEIIRKAKLS